MWTTCAWWACIDKGGLAWISGAGLACCGLGAGLGV